MPYAGYNFGTGQGILNYALDRANELALTDWLPTAQTDIQTAYIGVLETVTAPWARKRPPGVLITVPEITAGSVTLTTGSAAGTFSTPPAVSVAGRKIWVDNDQVVCRILTHIAGAAAFTMDAIYPETGGSGLAYHVFQDEYALASDLLAPRSKPFLKDCAGSYDVDLISQQEIDAWYPFSPMQGGTTLRVCAFIGDQTIRVAPWPRDMRRWEYEYNYNPGVLSFDGQATDAVIIQPAEDAVVVALFAIANVLLNKEDDRAGTFAEAAKGKLDAINGLSRKRQNPRLWVRSQYSVSGRR
jgi:hypothetical protein